MHQKLRHIVTRKYGLLTSDLFVRGLSNPENYRKVLLVDAFVSSGVILDRWCFGPQIAELGKRLLEKEEAQEGFLDTFFEHVYTFGNALLAFAKEIEELDLSDISMEEILDRFQKFAEQYEAFAVALAGWGLQIPVESQLREALKGRTRLDDDLAILSSPVKPNIINEERESLLRLGADVQKRDEILSSVEHGSVEVQQRIQEHAKTFGWMTRGGLDDPWTVEEVFSRLQDVLKADCQQALESLRVQREEALEKTQRLLDEMKADARLRRLVVIAKELVYFRTYRTDYLNMIMFHLRPLLQEIGQRLGNYAFQDIVYFRKEEVLRRHLVTREELARRKRNFFLFAVEPNTVIFSSEPEEVKRLEQEYLEQEQPTGTEVKGSVAFMGKATGKVVFVFGKQDLSKVQRGNILVSTMTTPDYIVAMEKAAAFVTDEGGITCHAAIVAREMKKPCIIGTKNATKVLKDGDEVEVDAERGIVRIIKRA